jgi:molybdopterin converting factor subunit 1
VIEHRVLLFAQVRESAGQDLLTLWLPEGATVGDLRHSLIQAIPGSAEILKRCLIALNEDYATDGEPLRRGVEIACIPPVSGG